MSLRTSRVGFEGFGLQAKPRPAGCRRIPRSPPGVGKTPAEYSGRFSLNPFKVLPPALYAQLDSGA